jgi:hypothetical protein
MEIAQTAPTVERRGDWIIVYPDRLSGLSIPLSLLTVNRDGPYAAGGRRAQAADEAGVNILFAGGRIGCGKLGIAVASVAE